MPTPTRYISHPGLVSAAALFASLAVQPAQAQSANMTFFVTSAGPGKGADLGGLDGADKHCQTLAAAAGAGAKTWRAIFPRKLPTASPR